MDNKSKKEQASWRNKEVSRGKEQKMGCLEKHFHFYENLPKTCLNPFVSYLFNPKTQLMRDLLKE